MTRAVAEASWPADKVERCPVDALIPYARNARTHSAEQVAQLAASIREWGWTIPVLIDETGGIIAGHGRVLAAQKLGIAEVPCMVATGWSEARKRAYVIADNKLTLNAGWDESLLAVELEDLSTEFGGLMGFTSEEIDALCVDKTAGLVDPDETPELQEDAVTELGDTWILGRHRLRCGDSTSADDVAALLNGVKPHLMVTDPPYGVAYNPAWRNEAGVSATTRTGAVRNDDRADWREAWALFPGDVGYVWHAGIHGRTVADSIEVCGFAIRAQLIWVKSRFVLSRGHYHWQHEPCFYAVRDGESRWQGARDQSTVWQIATNADDDTATVHGTQKPVECMLRPILNNSARGDAVYEPFAGSGSTIIAAEKSDRRCFGMEIEPRYCDVIVTRWQNFTGKPATLDGDGRTFEEVAGERLAQAA